MIQLPTLTPFLFAYAPAALLLFIVLHEKTLQRNLVALCSIPARINCQDWLDTLLSSSLALINTHKAITIIIEHKDSLDYLLTAPFIINADIEKNVLDIFLASASYDEQKMIWIDTRGKIRGMNATWNTHKAKIEPALFYTAESDAIIFNAHPISRTFTLIIKGKEIKNLSAHHVHTMIKKQLSPGSSSYSKGVYREKNESTKTISH
jgi:hypothetical protein